MSNATFIGERGYDTGLRQFLLSVYTRIGGGLMVSALCAFLASVPPLRNILFTVSTSNGHPHVAFTPLGLIVAFAPLVLMLGMFLTRSAFSERGSAFLYWATTVLFGFMLGVLVLGFSGASIAIAFFATAAAFGGLSLFGYTTKSDLSGLGSLLATALMSLIVVTLLSALFHIPGAHFVINIVGVLIFSGFIAYDTQKLKSDYRYGGGDLGTTANLAALGLYLDFINLFINLLQLFQGDD